MPKDGWTTKGTLKYKWKEIGREQVFEAIADESKSMFDIRIVNLEEESTTDLGDYCISELHNVINNPDNKIFEKVIFQL